MRQNGWVVLGVVFALGTAAWADDMDSRAKLNGAWQLGNDKDSQTWILDQTADAVHLTYMEGSRKVSEVECNTMGRECEMKKSGKSGKVSLWFSGSKLVELESRGQDVVKRRFGPGNQADTLDVEVIPVIPEGKAETLHLRRVQR